VRGRQSDNSLLRDFIGWEPATSLQEGLGHTGRWIESELRKAGRIRPRAAAHTA
jgi:GDP-D-mannose 3',5'-epimerase